MSHHHLNADLRRKIRQIEIYTRRLLTSSLVGDSRSAVRGSGFEFDQIREYRAGDDVRFIDWNASARINELLVKEFIEERSRTIILCVDVSLSSFFGSGTADKKQTMAEIASVLALVAGRGKDRIGLMLFSDTVELYVPPMRGLHHTHRLIEHLFCHEPAGRQTAINCALERLVRERQRDAIVFLISDFIDDEQAFTRYLPTAARLYDLIALRCLDKNERELPPVGILTIEDRETGEPITVNTSGGAKKLNAFFDERIGQQNKLFKKHGIEVVDATPNASFIPDLVRFFRRRMRY